MRKLKIIKVSTLALIIAVAGLKASQASVITQGQIWDENNTGPLDVKWGVQKPSEMVFTVITNDVTTVEKSGNVNSAGNVGQYKNGSDAVIVTALGQGILVTNPEPNGVYAKGFRQSGEPSGEVLKVCWYRMGSELVDWDQTKGDWKAAFLMKEQGTFKATVKNISGTVIGPGTWNSMNDIKSDKFVLQLTVEQEVP